MYSVITNTFKHDGKPLYTRIVIYRIVLQTAFRGYQNKNYKAKTSLVSPEGTKDLRTILWAFS